MPKRILAAAAVAVALTVTTALTGCGGSATPGAGSPSTTVRLGIGDPATSSMGVSAKHFADKVAELSDGKVKVETFPDGTLFGGDQNAAVNLLGNGTLDSTNMSTSVNASFEP